MHGKLHICIVLSLLFSIMIFRIVDHHETFKYIKKRLTWSSSRIISEDVLLQNNDEQHVSVEQSPVKERLSKITGNETRSGLLDIELDTLKSTANIELENPCLSPTVEIAFDEKCSPDDQESSWGPLLKKNFERMVSEDSKPGEEARTFMFQAETQAVSGECAAACCQC